MSLARDVSIQCLLSTHPWQPRQLSHPAGFAAGSHSSSGDRARSKGWGYSQIKAADSIRSIQGSTGSEVLAHQGTLRAEEAVRARLSPLPPLCHIYVKEITQFFV